MSPSTAPASIEVSWPGSPTSIEPRVRPHRLDQPRHQRQRHHRGLVDDHDVVRQPVARGRGGSGCGVPGRQPSSRCSVEASSRAARADAATASVRLVVHRLAQPRGGLAGRRGERDQRRRSRSACSSSSATIRATVVVLPVPGPPATTASRRRTAVAAASRWPSARRRTAARARRVEQRLVDAAPAPRERAQVGGDLALLAPVAVEVERAAVEPQRPARRARSPSDEPLAAATRPALRPRQRGQVDRLVGCRRSRCRGSSRGRRSTWPEPRARARRAPRPAATASSVSPRERGEPPRDVDVGGGEHAGVVELAQQAGRARAARRRRRSSHAARSSTSLSAAHQRGRRPPGEHAAAAPSTTGVSGPVIPRRNRYRTPARCALRRRSRAAASAGSGAARPCRAAPAGRSARAPSRRRAPPGRWCQAVSSSPAPASQFVL